MKVILIIIDGLGDRPILKLKNKTPLEAARKPNLNRLARQGINGLMNPLSPGIRPGSDIAHLAIFGYDPRIYYNGRGPFEAIGIGMDVDPGDVALRANFATVNKKLEIIDRRAGRIENTTALVEKFKDMVFEGIKFSLGAGVGHRAALVLKGENLSHKISNGDPHIEKVKVKKILPLDNSPEARRTAKILNKFLKKAHQILENHPLNQKRKKEGLLPANYLLLRGAGKLVDFEPFTKKYGFERACVIAGAGLYKGIGKILGMDIIEVEGATGTPDTNLEGKFKKAKEMLKIYDFIFLHIKGTDTLSEDGDFLGKKRFIEKIDKAIKPLLGLKNCLLVITSDHSTPCEIKAHSGDPVPLMIVGETVRTDACLKFEERESAQRGSLQRINGLDLMPEILNLTQRAKLFGA